MKHPLRLNTGTAMARKPLKEYFEQILQQCTDGAEIGDCDREGYDYCKNNIWFEEDGYLVDGSYDLAADHILDGDGYWTPYETIIRHASVSMNDIEVTWADPETDEEETVPESEIEELIKYLEKHIPDMVEG